VDVTSNDRNKDDVLPAREPSLSFRSGRANKFWRKHKIAIFILTTDDEDNFVITGDDEIDASSLPI